MYICVCTFLCMRVCVRTCMCVRACVTCRRVRESVRPSVYTVCASGDGATGVYKRRSILKTKPERERPSSRSSWKKRTAAEWKIPRKRHDDGGATPQMAPLIQAAHRRRRYVCPRDSRPAAENRKTITARRRLSIRFKNNRKPTPKERRAWGYTAKRL